jgi:hypothetical protein
VSTSQGKLHAPADPTAVTMYRERFNSITHLLGAVLAVSSGW